ncbi:serine threonine protein kinase : Serine/threonine protein kinase OS=Singulisphaera acidiphila (strain ATCC BAA-1392 / DSM 18658 / VKM B-2454 / MOB10) GN=Sinac_2761 PE=4 SV=1: Pkinase [Gemmata massiliana]|uniref:Protein kinase domain-containing protein n=2 Tax=Gemmata massiliana TaxID=1210884 RepID=A0A6P2CZP4_9BACT|nr:serine threonine protein kinase : Serine/threonine protein kinase OS=Singulisphaera acidiphila (strain ATCC BAA-1392 / DSM 18658 / VKM B-2454 / MOB10) GN=Sinac_2761 PE=4 SV=1: Pkinase [Gemmata massiliana]
MMREVARGGMGVVYAAHDSVFDREVAVKVMHVGQDAERFVVESKVTARLPHPGIPPCYALGALPDGRPFLAMKLISGRTLADELKTAGRNDLPRLLGIFEEICQTVGFAHSQGVIHRDLKPANVMVGDFGEVLVMDWGLAKLIDSNQKLATQSESISFTRESSAVETVAGLVKGTPAYMAPEQARGELVDVRTDVFALGGLLAVMLTGKPPFLGDTVLDTVLKAAQGELSKCFTRLDTCEADTALVQLAKRCLAVQAKDRFENGQAVAEAVAAYRTSVEERLQKTERDRAVSEAESREQRKRRKVQLALLAAGLLLVACGGVFVWWEDKQATARRYENDKMLDRFIGINRYGGQSEARQLGAQVQLRWVQLEAAARNQQLRELLQKGERLKDDPGAGAKLDQLLAELKEYGDKQFSDSEKASIWFANDAGGYQRGPSPPSEPSRHKYRGYRDYFNGVGEFPETASGTPPGIITRPHRSVAYRRKQDTGESVWAVAFTMPVMSDGPNPKPIGVVGMMIDLADAAPEDTNRFSVLIDTRPDFKTGRRGLILRHPYWSATKGESAPPLYYADAVVKWADTMREVGSDDLPLESGDEYVDPVSVSRNGILGQSVFEGRWLAAARRVRVGPDKVDTGWVVLVQMRWK